MLENIATMLGNFEIALGGQVTIMGTLSGDFWMV